MIKIKISLYADPHFSQSSSIIVGRKGEFTGRLDNLIRSFTWMNNFFKSQNVDEIICLGDLVDKPVLTSEEITAMSKCEIDNHYLIVGNHCRSDKDGYINALSIYKNVINKPGFIFDGVYFLPYNHDLIDLKSISPRPKVILSHNDIKGYNFGGHLSTEGYEISDILSSCDLFINGHLHNGGWVIKDKIMNLGTLSGMNFSSCNGEWFPSVAILDTETLEINLYENPEAYHFMKVEFKTLPEVKGFLDNLSGNHNVIQIKVLADLAERTRKLIEQSNKVEASRILTIHDNSKNDKSIVNKITLEGSNISIYDKLKAFISSQTLKLSQNKLNEIIDQIAEKEDNVQ